MIGLRTRFVYLLMYLLLEFDVIHLPGAQDDMERDGLLKLLSKRTLSLTTGMI